MCARAQTNGVPLGPDSAHRAWHRAERQPRRNRLSSNPPLPRRRLGGAPAPGFCVTVHASGSLSAALPGARADTAGRSRYTHTHTTKRRLNTPHSAPWRGTQCAPPTTHDAPPSTPGESPDSEKRDTVRPAGLGCDVCKTVLKLERESRCGKGSGGSGCDSMRHIGHTGIAVASCVYI